MAEDGTGNGNGNGGTWDKGFWRFVRYAGVIGGAVWFAVRLDVKVDNVAVEVKALREDVVRVAEHAMTREEASRLLDEANEQFKVEADRHGQKFRPLRMTR